MCQLPRMSLPLDLLRTNPALHLYPGVIISMPPFTNKGPSLINYMVSFIALLE